MGYTKSNSTKLTITALRIIAAVTAVIGVLALAFEIEQLMAKSYYLYFARLAATIISFIILILTESGFGKSKPFYLAHILVLVITAVSAFIIFMFPGNFVIDIQMIAVLLLIIGMTIGWNITNQVAAVVYSTLLLGAAIILQPSQTSQVYLQISSVAVYAVFSVISIIAASVTYKTRSEFSDSGNERVIQKFTDNSGVAQEHDIYRVIFDHSGDGLYRSSLDGKIILANSALAKLLGYGSVQELLDLDNAQKLYADPEDRDRLIKILYAQKRVKNYRVRLIKKDGSEFIARLNERLAFNNSEEPLYFEGSLQDITQQIKIEDERKMELQELREEKRKAVKDVNTAVYTSNIKAQFLASMSHELKTPINSIIGFLTLIEKGMFESEQELKDFAASAKNAADSLLDLINNVLDISKLEAGKMELDEVQFDLVSEMNKTKSIIKPVAQQKNIELIFEVPTNTPKVLFGDPVRLRQIMLNILSNAVKYTDKGQVKLQMEVIHQTEATIKFKTTVTDTGRGIPNDKLPLLFKPYTQLKDKKWSKKEGTGLGLMICKEFVKLMNGDIDIKSDEGKGTTVEFTVVLKNQKDFLAKNIEPKEEIIEPEIQKVKSELVEEQIPEPVIQEIETPDDQLGIIEPVSSNQERKRNRLLLVEDNPISQKVEKKLLKDSGYEVEAVSSGYDAIEAVKSRTFDLVLMDIEMPEMDGLTATQKIRTLNPPINSIPIIAVTAHSSMKDREKCLAAGMDDYIAKPININFMKMTIDQWLTRTYE